MSDLNQVIVHETEESLIMVGEGEIEWHQPLSEDDDFLTGAIPHCGIDSICESCQ